MMNGPATYDVSRVLDKLGGDREFLAECVDLFAAEVPGLMRALEDGVRTGEAARVHATAHTLKGMTSNFCEEGPARTAGQLEQIAREGRLDGADTLVAQLEDEIPRLITALETLKDSK